MPVKEIYRSSDSEGNLLTVEQLDNGDMYIYMYIKEEKRRRRELGYVDVSARQFRVKREREKHLHRKSNSYGFNEHVIKTAKTFDTVVLTDETGTYFIPLSEISKHGKYMFFKQKGFEIQLFVPLEIILPYKRKPIF